MLDTAMLGGMPIPTERLQPRDIQAEAAELRQLRAALKLSQKQVEQIFDIDRGTYSRWENAQRECQLGVLHAMRGWARELQPEALAATPKPAPAPKPKAKRRKPS